MKYFRPFYILFLFVLIGCTTQKTVVRTSKPSQKTRVVKKPTPQRTPQKQTESEQTSTHPEILKATTQVKVTTEVVKEYIQNYKEIAKENMRLHGIPASITLAQGILESGAGYSPLSQQANNHFGIKCHKEWTGSSISHDDDEKGECFRKYQHPSESYRDHSHFLTSRSRYASLFELPKDDYAAWAKGLRAAGYATDPKYPDKLISLIERYALHQYDAEVLGKAKKNNLSESVASSSQKTHAVSQGDTLYSISRKYNVSVEHLKQKNNLKDNHLSLGQILIID
jgi:flagellum-specific peptidoglycan hydrolase FlgJ